MLININGKDIGKELPAINVINPFNGECIDTVPDVPVELMDEAVKAAQEGLKYGADFLKQTEMQLFINISSFMNPEDMKSQNC